MPTVSYGSIGAAFGALGEAVAAQGSDEAVAAGKYLGAAGQYFEGIDGAIDGESAGHIIAGILGGVLIAEAFPIATVAPLLLASPLIAALPPVAAGLAVAGIIAAGYYFGAEAFALGYDLLGGLTDLLADILIDPIVLDLDGDGIELVPLAQSATMFDLDGDGVAERAGWVSPQDGLLVQDSNGNGAVDGVSELFGGANVDGYDELKTLDTNNDGRIDAADPAFAELRVWRDLNSDGLSTADELQTLADAGIARLNVGDDLVWGTPSNDMIIGGVGNDRLEGSSGADTYTYNLSDGDDVIYDYKQSDGTIDTLVFGAGIAVSDLLFREWLRTVRI